VIWAGADTWILQSVGRDDEQYLPYFFREGMAKYAEYLFVKGSQTGPQNDQTSGAVTALAASEGGWPTLMTADQMDKRCTWYTRNENLRILCMEEGAYATGYINREFGRETMAAFLQEIKKTHNWKTALCNVTGRDTDELWRDIIRSWNTGAKKK
jgi:hypothetical protein